MSAKTPIQQFIVLKALPLTTSATIKCGRIRWQGCFQPTPSSDCYTLRFDYATPRNPRITVVSPQLEIIHGTKLPHVYDADRLCLCYPWQWDSSKLIAHTLVPWASEWLLHYELWKATGKWHGGGHEPDSDRD